jgi:hypothetical protein
MLSGVAIDVEAHGKADRGQDQSSALLAISALASAFPFFRKVSCDYDLWLHDDIADWRKCFSPS